MAKKCKITNCNECPHMDNECYDYSRRCGLLDKEITDEMCGIYIEIYPKCPLKEWDEKEDKL